MYGIGEDTRVSDRFYLNSRKIRGFEFGGIGPRDANTGDSLGAKQYYVGSVQLAFPLGLPEEFDIRGRVFTDVGAAWGVDDLSTNVRVQDSSSPRVSIGGGFSWNSPLGPIEVDLGFPIVEEDFDQTELLSFSFGTSF
jgi:outer membrane protein insertion porin family